MDFHPVDALASRFRNIGQQWRSHPFQQLASLGAGALGGPLAARAAQFGFNRYNDSQFGGAANTVADRTLQQGNQAAQRGFDKPLNGPLGGFEGMGRPDNSALASALMGGGVNYGGTADARNGIYNMAQQFQNGQPPTMASLLSGMPGQQQSMTPQGSFFTDPRYDPANQQGSGNLRESRENDTRAAMTPLMQGVTNFSVGGFPVINGSRGYGAFGGSGQGYFKGRTPGR